MPKYYVRHNVTTAASTSVPLCAWQPIATTQVRRFKLLDIIFGFSAAPADATLEMQVARCTVAVVTPSGTVTPSPLDIADAAACFLATTGTYGTAPTVGVLLLGIALNQRNTSRWSAAPGEELVAPATAAAGLCVLSATISTGTPAVTVSAYIEE